MAIKVAFNQMRLNIPTTGRGWPYNKECFFLHDQAGLRCTFAATQTCILLFRAPHLEQTHIHQVHQVRATTSSLGRGVRLPWRRCAASWSCIFLRAGARGFLALPCGRFMGGMPHGDEAASASLLVSLFVSLFLSKSVSCLWPASLRLCYSLDG